MQVGFLRPGCQTMWSPHLSRPGCQTSVRVHSSLSDSLKTHSSDQSAIGENCQSVCKQRTIPQNEPLCVCTLVCHIGECRIAWEVASATGHRAQGLIRFRIRRKCMMSSQNSGPRDSGSLNSLQGRFATRLHLSSTVNSHS